MGNTVSECTQELKSYKAELKNLNMQKEENEKIQQEKEAIIVDLRKERDELSESIHKIGFFKFSERKPLKIKKKAIVKDIKEGEHVLIDLKTKEESLINQIAELSDKIKFTSEQQARLQRDAEIEMKAQQGDPQAQYEKAKKYPSENFTEALEWLSKAAAQGHSDAQRMKSKIENEEFIVKIANSTAFDIVAFEVYHNSLVTHRWQGLLSCDGFPTVICRFKKGEVKLEYKYFKVSVKYTLNVNGRYLAFVKEDSMPAHFCCENDEKYARVIFCDKRF